MDQTAATALSIGPQFVFASSYSIHGPRNPYRELSPLTAETPVNPDDNYGRHKAAGEQMVQSSGLPWTILRLPTVMATAKGWGQSIEFFRFAFLLPLDRRAHVLHSSDAGLALANAVDNERAVERLFVLGGPDENCRITRHDFFTGIGQARGIPFPPSAFRLVDPNVDASWYYEDWVDTRESQEIPQYQNHTFADYLQHIRRQTRFARPLLRLFQPLVRRRVAKESPYYEEGPVVAGERMWPLICEMFDVDPNQR
ncbi:MAG: NAD(P)-dependent oxidoreductase [Chloroflexota bacterium]|nr:MAG: NAD(P)-dependent oxidoreductase [Chloroflexota bacterium]